jgi:hypothetical protein
MRVLAFLVVAGCAHPYAYSFRWADPDVRVAVDGREVREDADVKAALRVDGPAVLLDLTNKTEEVLQVQWGEISLARPDGQHGMLRPDIDLGWIPPGATTTARLVPLVVPRDGPRALAYQDGQFELDVPVTVRREPRRYHFTLIASVREL